MRKHRAQLKYVFILLMIFSLAFVGQGQSYYDDDYDYEDEVTFQEEPAEGYEVSPELIKDHNRKIDQDQLSKFKEQSRFEYQPEEKKSSNEIGFFTNIIVQIGKGLGWVIKHLGFMAYILFIAVIAGIIYMFIKSSNAGFEAKVEKMQHEEIVFEDLEANIHDIDFEARIREALAAGDFSKVIQLFYLKCLKALSDSGMIALDEAKTNHDYISEIKSQKVRSNFRHLTLVFEYIRYGDFEIDQQRFEGLRPDFEKFPTQLNKPKK